MDVPPFDSHASQDTPMDKAQRAFYRHWLKSWKMGQPIPVDGNCSYLLAYAFKVIKLTMEEAVPELDRLISAYPEEKDPFRTYCLKWASDYYLLAGDFRTALNRYPPLQLGGTATHSANEILNIKRELNDFVGAAELLGLIGPTLTTWAKKNIEEVVAYLDITLGAHQKSLGRSLLVDWSFGENKYGWYLFSGSNLHPVVKKPYYCYYTNRDIQNFANSQLRDAENTVREGKGIPRVGEGWIAETVLFYQIREAFPGLDVLHHARPEWLKPQHLDVYLPEFRIALEYHGAQHDEPVEYFGGLKQFEATQKRDAKKLNVCMDNGVVLLYVREGYDLSVIVSEIQGIMTASGVRN